MPPVIESTYANTTVFWDMEDFPLPAGLSLCEIIKSALLNEGNIGEVSIRAYSEKLSEKMNKPVPKGDKYWRINKMMLDIGWWATENPDPRLKPVNLMVIAKNMEKETQFASFLSGLRSLGYNVLFALPFDCDTNKVEVPYLQKVWYWEGLLKGDKPLVDSVLSPLIQAYYRDAPKGFLSEVVEEEDDNPCFYCSQVKTHCISTTSHADCEKNELMSV